MFLYTMQLLEAEKKYIYMINLKGFIFKLDNFFITIYVHTYFLESKFIAHDVKPGFVACRIRRFSGKSRY